MAHAYQTDLKASSTSFLAYDRHTDGDIVFEESADVQGVFMAYLAGYRTTQILPELIKCIYQEFDLPARLTGYPSLLERQNTVKKVQSMSTELIRVYEAGNYLFSMSKYDLAISCFEHVENWYKGREVYNNLGLGYAYLAMNFTANNADPYLFPLEISWDTRMKKPLAPRGGKDLEPEERRLRGVPSKGGKHFVTASKMDLAFSLQKST
ncbi:MAG: hypothetical protein IPM82_20715 [Saprospiraceae bacterium]|nr:hypothetical protein [Saprospiraceae bacterium]